MIRKPEVGCDAFFRFSSCKTSELTAVSHIEIFSIIELFNQFQ